jgi:hypothetical protein
MEAEPENDLDSLMLLDPRIVSSLLILLDKPPGEVGSSGNDKILSRSVMYNFL